MQEKKDGYDTSTKPTANSNVLEMYGTRFSNLTPELKQQLHIKSSITGILVENVGYRSQWRGFLAKGDIILEANKQNINNVEDFSWQYKKVKREKKQNITLLVKRKTRSIFIAIPVV